METAGSSYRSVATYQSTRRNIPEDFNLHQHRCKNLQSDTILLISEKTSTKQCASPLLYAAVIKAQQTSL